MVVSLALACSARGDVVEDARADLVTRWTCPSERASPSGRTGAASLWQTPIFSWRDAMAWSTWTRWNDTIEQTLSDAQHAAAGDASLADAKTQARKTGTPGILTVDTLADHLMLGRLWVLSHDDLHQHFGSKTPPKKAIEAVQATFIESLEAGESVAVTAFARGVPTAVLFAGRPGKR